MDARNEMLLQGGTIARPYTEAPHARASLDFIAGNFPSLVPQLLTCSRVFMQFDEASCSDISPPSKVTVTHYSPMPSKTTLSCASECVLSSKEAKFFQNEWPNTMMSDTCDWLMT